MSPEFFDGNDIRLLESGSDFFPAMIQAVDAASNEVHLETYIFADDSTGQNVAAALVRAAQRQVSVRVLIDGFGADGFLSGLGVALVNSGAEVLAYRPDKSRGRWRRSQLRRLHRKLVVIDGTVAFVGGINILDDFDDGKIRSPRFDYAVRIEGPLVGKIHGAMRHVWRLVRWAKLRQRPPPPPQAFSSAVPRSAGMRAAFVIRDNFRHRHDIENAYLVAMSEARRDIIIANAYFLPGRKFRQALYKAAQSNIQVTLLLQGRVEHALQHYATQYLYRRLLGAGVRIFEYQRSFLHAKVAVIDDRWATVGSSNIDPFSLLLAREANVVVSDCRFAESLRFSLNKAMVDGATEVRLADLQQQTMIYRFLAPLAYAAVRLLLNITGYAKSFNKR